MATPPGGNFATPPCMGIDLDQLWGPVATMWRGFVAIVPRILVGAIVIVVFLLVARGVRALVRRRAQRESGHRPLAIALGRLAHAGILLLGILVAITATFPGFTPTRLVSALGIGSVAIGFAFKDIFQNFVAGILILWTRPFIVGDQIVYREWEGSVEHIQTRATFIRTYDGRRVIIPNSELYTNPVIVNTAFPQRRWEYDIGIGYGDDVEKARLLILDVLEETEGVAPDPKADVIVVKFDESSVNLRARWWSDSRIADMLLAQDRVLAAVKTRLGEAGIDLPYPTRQILFHDQTEATDGNRREQREGWPAGPGAVPPPRTSTGERPPVA